MHRKLTIVYSYKREASTLKRPEQYWETEWRRTDLYEQHGQSAVVADLVGTERKDRKEMTDLNTEGKRDRVHDYEYDRDMQMKYRVDINNHNESEVWKPTSECISQTKKMSKTNDLVKPIGVSLVYDMGSGIWFRKSCSKTMQGWWPSSKNSILSMRAESFSLSGHPCWGACWQGLYTWGRMFSEGGLWWPCTILVFCWRMWE